MLSSVIANSVHKGYGSADAPIVICNHTDLMAIDTSTSADKHYILGADIDLSSSPNPYHTPVGSAWNESGMQVNLVEPFKGIFDGNNKKILGLQIYEGN